MLSRPPLVGSLLLVAACSAQSPATSYSSDAASGSGGARQQDSAAPIDQFSPPQGDDAETTSDAGGGGGSVEQDATVGTPDAAADARVATDFACNLIIGINATGEWYKQGYENLVDNARWELIQVHNGFIENWADPNNDYWATGMYSPCTKDPKLPDRIFFVLSNFDYTMIEQWLPPLKAVIKNLQTKYPSVKNIELMTWVRAPGNMPCPQAPAYRSTISAGEDQAIAQAAKDLPNLVTVAPKFEAHSCSEYTDNPPHPTAEGGAAWAKMIAAYYNPKP